MESQRRSERTKTGMARARVQGKILGRPKGSKDKKRKKNSISSTRFKVITSIIIATVSHLRE
jgi:DNA invertase Pin-like site-specific DNA recombinase